MISPKQHEQASHAAVRGALYGLGAAALFGLSAPLAKRLLGEVAPQLLAGILYLGAGLSLHVWRAVRPATREAALSRKDAGWLAGIVVTGGILGPLLMLTGLSRISGVTASLLLNLEAPFTIAIAVVVFREHLGRYGLAAISFILAGAVLLNLERGSVKLDAWGVAAITAACLAWAIDNNLTQRVSSSDPVALVRFKALAAGTINATIGFATTPELPSAAAIAGALAVGATGYGLSVVLDTYALRLVGAAREAAYFATAPFVGAVAATFILGETLELIDGAAMALMALGVVALLRERHTHRHTHDPLEHDHLHVHDAHHHHEHGPGVSPLEPHAHPHRHAPLVHDHPHVPDAHHRHRH